MNTDAQADDSVRLSTLHAIQTLQQDQLNVLEILGKLIHGMEALDIRLRKLEDDHARTNWDGDAPRQSPPDAAVR
jgi:hypothetical protein